MLDIRPLSLLLTLEVPESPALRHWPLRPSGILLSTRRWLSLPCRRPDHFSFARRHPRLFPADSAPCSHAASSTSTTTIPLAHRSFEPIKLTIDQVGFFALRSTATRRVLCVYGFGDGCIAIHVTDPSKAALGVHCLVQLLTRLEYISFTQFTPTRTLKTLVVAPFHAI
ncbi:hypothetical protein DFH06DRAFT_1351644 [Mycena polygramma]|nr:hypothetical protein DFH06DRAFT_1351621 [Mycena polygramma]KAJ7602124.1 hypothetical protein DFH06DRAFT_1351627 [Mycena polygramma]KAJ7602131.1 hypothetical protein DFH06DRAFT_1351633 [Mycena polygramma]KAJ7602137.1 hypothetical protein DFH06DRAFT_1351639 [Mycena polygramma]KAJ7602142.1 hypothetical protein DFH06DRAFT_1351644 [Mycena polygramma]